MRAPAPCNSPRQLSGHGVSYWTDGTEERIIYVTIGYRMLSLDAKTGIPDPNFGDKGVVDLKLNDDQTLDPVTADIGLHATPTIARNVVIVGAAHTCGDVSHTRYNAKGYVRGFDVKTGQRKWIFHTIPQKGEFGYDSWTQAGQAEKTGNAGDWAQNSADEELGLVYLGVELPTGDEMGIYRAGPGLFGESIVALDIETGLRKWHYQLVHHGLQDRDISGAAILCDIPITARSSRRSPSLASNVTSMCWTARPASRCGRSRKSRCPRAMCRANGIRRPSRCRPSRRHMTARACHRPI